MGEVKVRVRNIKRTRHFNTIRRTERGRVPRIEYKKFYINQSRLLTEK